MSKRHRKTKLTFGAQAYDENDMPLGDQHYDLSMYQAPKGKKPKGRDKRASHKRAYYDD